MMILQKTKDLLLELPDGEVDFTVTTVVLLFTPQLARFHTEDVVKRILSHLCRRYLETDSVQPVIRVVTGIVDKVPGSAYNARPGSPAAEGVSVILTNSFLSQVLHDADKHSDQPAVLRFGSIADRLRYPGADGQADTFGTHELHLAMANTLFVNGRHSTLAESLWRRKRRGSSKSPKLKRGFRYLKDYMLHAGVPSGALFGSIMPLTPLTNPRPIRTALGNIIREIEVDGKVVPAAQELETSVPEFIKTHDNALVGGKVLVFALVHDPDASPVLSVRAPTAISAKIKASLDGGARLLRVTGGGGGWGQKKGLLSLEPATGHGIHDGSGRHATPDDTKMQEDAGQIMEDITQSGKVQHLVQEGGAVQFFICVNEPNETAVVSHTQREFRNNISHTIVAGMIPQNESVPTDRPSSDGESTQNNTRLIKDTFGALSEQGLGLVIKDYLDDGKARPEHAKPQRGLDERVLSSTRFDVPNVRFEYKVKLTSKQAAKRAADRQASDRGV
ncbi:hypothetical protein DV738_g3054, partial [Chaetothyriales sp. CBS 135597]